MFARFDENPAMTLQDIKETKRYGRTDARTDARTDGQRENSIPTTNKVCGGYKYGLFIYTERPVIDANMFIKTGLMIFLFSLRSLIC